MKLTESQKTSLHFILAGVLMNGYMRGCQGKVLETEVLKLAEEEIQKLLLNKQDGNNI